MNMVEKVPTQSRQVVATCKTAICLRNSTIWFQLEIRTPANFVSRNFLWFLLIWRHFQTVVLFPVMLYFIARTRAKIPCRVSGRGIVVFGGRRREIGRRRIWTAGLAGRYPRPPVFTFCPQMTQMTAVAGMLFLQKGHSLETGVCAGRVDC
jgi:hypothetical protein